MGLSEKKFNFRWSENGINHPHHKSGEEWYGNLVLDDVLYIAFLSAKSEDVKDLKMAPSCNVMKDLLREKGLI